MSDESLLGLSTSSATHVGAKIDSIHLAKVVISLLRKLDRDTGVAEDNYESLISALVITDDPATVVP